MKNFEQILKDVGIEIPEDKKEQVKKEFAENYKTVADYNKQNAKRDDLQKSLDEVQEKLKSFDGVDVASLKQQVADLQGELKKKEDERKEELTRAEREKVLNEFLNGKKFVNEFTEKHIRAAVMSELEKGTGKSVDKIFDELTKKEGKLMPNILQDDGGDPPPRFTKVRSKQAKIYETKEEIMKIKDAAERQRAIADNAELFGYAQ